MRCGLLFTNFFLIIAALYQLKPASRSIFLQQLGAEQLPYVWIGTALALWVIISFYYRLVARFQRLHVVIVTILIMAAILLAFRLLLVNPNSVTAFAFYIFVDIFSVILVEQFWSITNTVYSTDEGKRWYGLIATGGLTGGMIGSYGASLLIRDAGLQTMNLLLVAVAILACMIAITLVMQRFGLYDESRHEAKPAGKGSWRTVIQHRYLALITMILLCAQMMTPLVEYQFMSMVEGHFTELEPRTAYLSQFFSVLSAVAIAINLLLTPVIHRLFGIFAGLSAQPLTVICTSLFYIAAPNLTAGAAMMISDRGLSYSINRASKELLYIPIDPVLIFQAKAWIDMFGYRIFKILGSLLILLLTQWLPWHLANVELGWVILLICMMWGMTLIYLRREYHAVSVFPPGRSGR